MKKASCRFKGTCKFFVNKQQCPFSHDICKKGPACQFQQKCAYYHPQLDRPKEKTAPRGQLPCRFGARCIKQKTNQCPYNHQATQQIKKIPKPCRNGQQCRYKNTCPYEHSESSAPNYDKQIPNQGMKKIPKPCRNGQQCRNKNCMFEHQKVPDASRVQPSPQNSFFQRPQPKNDMPQINNNSFASKTNSFASKTFKFDSIDYCTQFMLNRCNEEICPSRKKHSFIKNDSLKRLFYSGASSFIKKMSDLKILFIDRATYFVFLQQDMFHFMKFNQTYKVMQKATDFVFKTGSRNSALVIEEGIMFFSSNNNIITYKPKQGSIQLFPLPGQVLSIVLYEQDSLIILCQNQLPKVFVKNNISNEKTNILCQNLIKMGIRKVLSIKKLTCMSQPFFIGFGQKQLIFWNKKLQSKIIQLNGKPFDADSIVSGNHPFCLVTVLSVQKQITQIKALDLISLQVTTICSAKINSNEYFTKIICVDKNCYVQQNDGCLLIFEIPNFQEFIGMIGFSSQIVSMCKDKDNKLIIFEKNPNSGQGSFSIYKKN